MAGGGEVCHEHHESTWMMTTRSPDHVGGTSIRAHVHTGHRVNWFGHYYDRYDEATGCGQGGLFPLHCRMVPPPCIITTIPFLYRSILLQLMPAPR